MRVHGTTLFANPMQTPLATQTLLVMAQCIVVACMLRIAVRFVALPRLARALRATSVGARSRAQASTQVGTAAHATRVRAAHVASRLVAGSGPCLIRALLLLWLHRRDREPLTLWLGVERSVAHPRQWHAWVEHRGEPVGESRDHIARFTRAVRL